MKKLISVMLAALLVCSCFAGAETEKRERVFVVANADGSVKTLIDSVYLDNKDVLDVIEDKSGLTGIENVSGQETFTLDGTSLTWQANGACIRYQGSSDKLPAVVPVVTTDTRDGITTLTVTYTENETYPCAAVSAIVLSGCENAVAGDNCIVLGEGDIMVALGIGICGIDAAYGLPDGFTVRYDESSDATTWMLTFASASPLKAACGELDADTVNAYIDDAQSILKALANGEALPESSEQADTVNSLSQLLNGIASIASGTAQVDAGTAQLSEGLNTLTANNEALVSGAQTVFDSVLATANSTIASSGLEAQGIEVPTLTADNYSDAIDTLTAALTYAVEHADETAKAQVTAAVEAAQDQIVSAVTDAVRTQVLEAGLKQAGYTISASTYNTMCEKGLISADKQSEVNTAVDAYMAGDEAQALIAQNVAEQKEKLIEENLNSDDTQAQIAASIETANSAIAELTSLKEQLTSLSQFVDGVKAYTDGVQTAATGAEQLKTGTAQLSAGAATLNDTVTSVLTDNASLLLEKLNSLPIKETLSDVAAALNGDLSYDMGADETVYVIRTVIG